MFPEIRFSDSIVLPTYHFYLSLLYCFLIFYVVRRARAQNLNVGTTLDFGLIMMVAGFLGARLVHVFYEVPHYYAEDWTRAFKFWEGGFVFFGGFLSAFLACLIYQRRKTLSFSRWADFFAPLLALGYGLGRISCFLAGCCYGRYCDLPWAVVFSWDYHQAPRHPTQLYAVIWELAIFGLLIWFEKKKFQLKKPGLIFFFWLFLHSIGRLFMEYFRDDFRGDLIVGLSLSTWVSLALLSVSVTALTTGVFARKSSKH